MSSWTRATESWAPSRLRGRRQPWHSTLAASAAAASYEGHFVDDSRLTGAEKSVRADGGGGHSRTLAAAASLASTLRLPLRDRAALPARARSRLVCLGIAARRDLAVGAGCTNADTRARRGVGWHQPIRSQCLVSRGCSLVGASLGNKTRVVRPPACQRSGALTCQGPNLHKPRRATESALTW